MRIRDSWGRVSGRYAAAVTQFGEPRRDDVGNHTDDGDLGGFVDNRELGQHPSDRILCAPHVASRGLADDGDGRAGRHFRRRVGAAAHDTQT